ncbi:hypothetical protein L0222_11685 [bacterium]|nr:hypothetical protein [bacterium]MCI0603570.1 hypothetical protein [bacterium]
MLADAIAELADRPELLKQQAQTVTYRFGDGSLAVTSDYKPFIRELHEYFPEYEISPTQDAQVHCEIRTTLNADILYVNFRRPENLDALGFGLGQLEHPLENPYYTEMHSSVSGWRFIGHSKSARLVMAANNAVALIDVSAAPPHFLVDYLLSILFSIQKELLFLHAGSIKIGRSGVLLLGPSKRGKTTLSMALASRGHGFLGDDIAPVRAVTREILPFRKAISVRSGPRAQDVDEILNGVAFDENRMRFQIHELFPQSKTNPVLATHAFILRAFAGKPAVEKFDPSLQNPIWKDLSINQIVVPFWGVTTERRLMQFLVFIKLLSKLHCWLLDAGTPDETADLIESMTEES